MKKFISLGLLFLSLSLTAMEDPIDPGMPRVTRTDYSDPALPQWAEQIMFAPLVSGLKDSEKEFLKAAWRLNAVEVKKKLAEGISVNTRSEGGCALHWALKGARTNYELLDTLLLQKDVNVNLTDNSQLSVLDFTIAYMEHSYNPATEKMQFAQFLIVLLAKKARPIFEGKSLEDHMPAFAKHPELHAIVENHLKKSPLRKSHG